MFAGLLLPTYWPAVLLSIPRYLARHEYPATEARHNLPVGLALQSIPGVRAGRPAIPALWNFLLAHRVGKGFAE
ncbi:hypothetical protein FQZ97_989620 [compost metagenome]